MAVQIQELEVVPAAQPAAAAPTAPPQQFVNVELEVERAQRLARARDRRLEAD